jgi:hypothetical protein
LSKVGSSKVGSSKKVGLSEKVSLSDKVVPVFSPYRRALSRRDLGSCHQGGSSVSHHGVCDQGWYRQEECGVLEVDQRYINLAAISNSCHSCCRPAEPLWQGLEKWNAATQSKGFPISEVE